MSAGLVPSGAPEGESIPGLSPSFWGVAGHPCHSSAHRASHVQWCAPCMCVSVSKCSPFYQDTSHVGLGPIQLPHFNLMVWEDLLSIKSPSQVQGVGTSASFAGGGGHSSTHKRGKRGFVLTLHERPRECELWGLMAWD